MKPRSDICVVGTDTGVGKTVVSLLLMQWFHAKGYNPFYLKPFQTGCADPYDVESDAAFVYRHTAALRQKDPAHSVIFCYRAPKAPLYAAHDAGSRIDSEKVYQRVHGHRLTHSPLVVEAAGGLLVPVTEDQTVIDLIAHFHCHPILVARTGLGTINHTLLSIEALRSRNLPPLGVLMVQPEGMTDDPGLVGENISAIETFSGVPVGGVIPPISDFNLPPPKAYLPIENLVG